MSWSKTKHQASVPGIRTRERGHLMHHQGRHTKLRVKQKEMRLKKDLRRTKTGQLRNIAAKGIAGNVVVRFTPWKRKVRQSPGHPMTKLIELKKPQGVTTIWDVMPHRHF